MKTSHPPTSESTITPSVVLVTSPACHLCEDAHDHLVDLVARRLLGLRLVAADSDQGRSLVGQHRPSMFPLVLVDGEFFSAGRLPRRKLDHLLARKATR